MYSNIVMYCNTKKIVLFAQVGNFVTLKARKIFVKNVMYSIS